MSVNPLCTMEPKRTRYDTNPLDPDVARRSEEAWEEGEAGAATGAVKGATSPVVSRAPANGHHDAYSEAPTRTFATPPAGDSSYPSVFAPPTYAPPAEVYKPPQIPIVQPVLQDPSSRTVTGLGLAEKWAVMLPYAPLYIGVVASILELILVPRTELRVRGHASQGLALHMGIVAITMLFGVLSAITGSHAGANVFWLAQFIFLIVSMIRVGNGATHRIAPLTDPADWLNKHIDPRK